MRPSLLTVVLLAAMPMISIASCSRSEPTPPPATKAAPAKDPVAARALIAQGAVVIDVRTADEFAGGHVPNATNLAVEHFGDHLAEVDKLVAGDKSRAIVVYCSAGSRAAQAKKILDDAGYQHVVNGGGYHDLR
ncbi:MAG: rhodanese-like domain-containing protein [Kofleriaceae bacterium]